MEKSILKSVGGLATRGEGTTVSPDYMDFITDLVRFIQVPPCPPKIDKSRKRFVDFLCICTLIVIIRMADLA
jgi:hypothetical protein